VGIPLGIRAARSRLLGHFVVAASGVVQTIPSVALLCFLIPVLGIGSVPAVVALFLYGLFPIVRGTVTGLRSVDPRLLDVAYVLGMTPRQRLWRVELPLASVAITNGIKLTAVTNVGTATLAALIGGGGYGTLIVTGLGINDPALVLAGAVPSALLALLVHGAFELLDRLIVPAGLHARGHTE
jgi:osmoprotectant transport system permease protein